MQDRLTARLAQLRESLARHQESIRVSTEQVLAHQGAIGEIELLLKSFEKDAVPANVQALRSNNQ